MFFSGASGQKHWSPFSLPWRSHGLVNNRNAAFLPLFLLLLCLKCSQEELWLSLSLSGTWQHLIATTSWFLWPPLKCLFPVRGSPQIEYLSSRDDYYGASLHTSLDQLLTPSLETPFISSSLPRGRAFGVTLEFCSLLSEYILWNCENSNYNFTEGHLFMLLPSLEKSF